jgi:hypothetical protein
MFTYKVALYPVYIGLPFVLIQTTTQHPLQTHTTRSPKLTISEVTSSDLTISGLKISEL